MMDGWEPIGDVSAAGEQAVAAVILEDADGRVLLQLRDSRPEVAWGGYWSFFGGGVEVGESLTEAACREIEEELDIALKPDELEPFRWVCSPSETRPRFYTFRSTRTVRADEIRLSEGAGFAFFREEQLDALAVVPFTEPILQAYLAERRKA